MELIFDYYVNWKLQNSLQTTRWSVNPLWCYRCAALFMLFLSPPLCRTWCSSSSPTCFPVFLPRLPLQRSRCLPNLRLRMRRKRRRCCSGRRVWCPWPTRGSLRQGYEALSVSVRYVRLSVLVFTLTPSTLQGSSSLTSFSYRWLDQRRCICHWNQISHFLSRFFYP